jgi:hypothetical protein
VFKVTVRTESPARAPELTDTAPAHATISGNFVIGIKLSVPHDSRFLLPVRKQAQDSGKRMAA